MKHKGCNEGSLCYPVYLLVQGIKYLPWIIDLHVSVFLIDFLKKEKCISLSQADLKLNMQPRMALNT